jgi:hypothetical protein
METLTQIVAIIGLSQPQDLHLKLDQYITSSSHEITKLWSKRKAFMAFSNANDTP